MNLDNTARLAAPSRSTPARCRGFSLVEVMVALVIIAIGSLGIAKMQALALASTGASRSRALAAIEASSLAQAMRANRVYWSSNASLPGTVQVLTTVGGVSSVTSDSASMQTALTAASAATGLCPATLYLPANSLSCYCAVTPSPCVGSNINMAASDLYDWSAGLGTLLPQSKATVTCNNGNTPVDCTINIQWIENAVALNTNETAAVTGNGNTTKLTTAAFQYVAYSLYVVP